MTFEAFKNNQGQAKEKHDDVEKVTVPEKKEEKEGLGGMLRGALEKIKSVCSPLIGYENKLDEIDSSVGLEHTDKDEVRKEFVPQFSEIKDRASSIGNAAEEKFDFAISGENKDDAEIAPIERLRTRQESERDEEERNERWVEQRLKTLDVQEKITGGVSPDEVAETIKQNIPEFSPQRRKIERVLEKYRKSSEAVKKCLETHPSSEQCFEALCGFRANGKVEMHHGVSDITFITDNENDFGKVVTGKDLGEEELLRLSGHGGVTTMDVPKDFEGAGLIVLSRQGMERTKDVLGDAEVHERQHVNNNLYIGERRSKLKYVSDEEIKNAPEDQKREKILSRLRYQRQYADNNKMSDELLAHYKGLDIKTEDEVGKKITANLVISYREKFYSNTIDMERKKLEKMGIEKSAVDECITEIFQNESWRTIRDSANALHRLENAGFSKDQAINLVQFEPLSSWATVADKLIEYRKVKSV